jgi:putative addiction module component (TIGR02574 family)
MMSADHAELLELSVPDRLRLIEELWDSIASTPETIPVPEWHKDEVARRQENYLRNPHSAIPWDEAKERLRNRNA